MPFSCSVIILSLQGKPKIVLNRLNLSFENKFVYIVINIRKRGQLDYLDGIKKSVFTSILNMLHKCTSIYWFLDK